MPDAHRRVEKIPCLVHLFIHQAEISVINHDNDILPGLCSTHESVSDRMCFFRGTGIAGWIIGRQNDNALGAFTAIEGDKSRNVIPTVNKGWIGFDFSLMPWAKTRR